MGAKHGASTHRSKHYPELLWAKRHLPIPRTIMPASSKSQQKSTKLQYKMLGNDTLYPYKQYIWNQRLYTKPHLQYEF